MVAKSIAKLGTRVWSNARYDPPMMLENSVPRGSVGIAIPRHTPRRASSAWHAPLARFILAMQRENKRQANRERRAEELEERKWKAKEAKKLVFGVNPLHVFFLLLFFLPTAFTVADYFFNFSKVPGGGYGSLDPAQAEWRSKIKAFYSEHNPGRSGRCPSSCASTKGRSASSCASSRRSTRRRRRRTRSSTGPPWTETRREARARRRVSRRHHRHPTPATDPFEATRSRHRPGRLTRRIGEPPVPKERYTTGGR